LIVFASRLVAVLESIGDIETVMAAVLIDLPADAALDI
jgi:hypothetical protein